MILASQQLRAVELVESGKSTFISGMAGTGKSTVTVSIVSRAKRNIDLCATTGIAALNLQQQFLDKTGEGVTTYTIYRYAGIALGPNPGQTFENFREHLGLNMTKSRQKAYARIVAAKTVIIDEISMLPGRLLDFLDFHFRKIRGVDKPFGGVQIVAVGDFLQLPPVAKNGIYDWAFNSNAWKSLEMANCYLTQIFRQNELDFTNALNEFRTGKIRGKTANLLSKRIARFPDRTIPRLFTHNTMVEKWNSYQLDDIEEKEEKFIAKTEGDQNEIDFLIKNLVTPEILKLKIGARVMFTSNLTYKGDLYVTNGECGTVLAFNVNQTVEIWSDETGEWKKDHVTLLDSIRILKDNGGVVLVNKHTWNFDPQNRYSSTFTQYPLRLSYAFTIHKSQGLTLDRALIDIRAAREPGQAYVALSRVRSLAGLFLKDWFSGVFVSNEAIEFYREIEKQKLTKV